MKNLKRPLNRSITIGCVMFIITLCILLSLANLRIYKSYVYSDYRGYISDILEYTADHIDGDDLGECIKTRKESKKYKKTLLFMDDLMNHYDDIHYFYALLPLNTNDTKNMMSVLSAERYHDRYVDTEGNLYLGWISDDEYDGKTMEKFFKIMDSDKITYFEEKTEWGTDYTGAMAIKDSKGNGVAVLAVDIDISFITKMIWRYALTNIIIILIAGLIFIGLFLIWSRRNITKPIMQLEESAVGFASNSHGQRDVSALSFVAPEMKRDNEIKSLSDAVVKMTEDMQDYVSEIINAEEEAANMKELANRDSLTGIRNKTAYDNAVKRVGKEIENGYTKVGIAIVDLNFLKKINDTYGHEKGDLAIQKLCKMTCDIFAHSPVFRIGGDELAVILHGNDYDNYGDLETRFNDEIELLQKDDSLQPWEKTSAAIGAAFYDKSIDNGLDSLFRRADHIMYDRKKEMKAARTD